MSEFDLTKPQSRSEKILGKMTKDYSGELDPPQSRVEAYLSKLSEGGSSDGDYVTVRINIHGNATALLSYVYRFVFVKHLLDLESLLQKSNDLYGDGCISTYIINANNGIITIPKSEDIWDCYVLDEHTSVSAKLPSFIANTDVEINFNTNMTKQHKYSFGIIENGADGNTNMTVNYLDDNADFKPLTVDLETGKVDYGDWKDAFFMPRSCMLRSDGTVAYYLDENDETKKEDGTPSDVGNPDFDGNAMMEFGSDLSPIYIGIDANYAPGVPADLGYKVTISNYQVSQSGNIETSTAWPFYGKYGIVSHFYMPKYNSSFINGKLRSLSGQHIVGKETGIEFTAEQEMNYAKANGSGWCTETKAQVDFINILLTLITKSVDSQSVLGKGYVNTKNDYGNLLDTGTANGKGMFYGTSSGTTCVKVFGIENWWGNQWRRYAGHMMINGVQKVKLTYGTEDGSTVVGYNTTGDGYITIDDVTLLNKAGDTSGGGYPREMSVMHRTLVPKGLLYDSSLTTYCDYCSYNNTNTVYAMRGGPVDDGEQGGAFSIRLSAPSDAIHWDICAGISYTPDRKPLEPSEPN